MSLAGPALVLSVVSLALAYSVGNCNHGSSSLFHHIFLHYLFNVLGIATKSRAKVSAV